MGSRFEDSTSSLQYKRHDASSMTSVVSPPCSDARTKKRRLSLVPEERRSHEPSFREKALALVGQNVPLFQTRSTRPGSAKVATRALRDLAAADLERAARHPRLGTPMRVVDLAYFVAEHDDHHLARLRELLTGAPPGE